MPTDRTRMPRRFWQDMAWPEFRHLTEATVAVLPVAAVEQHGPHLPVAVDACINQGLLAEALARAPDSLPITVLPMQCVGKSEEHLAYPGTLTLSAETLARVLAEIGESVARAGLRRLMLLNSHGGQPQVLDIVARGLRVRHGMFVAHVGWHALGLPPGLFSAEEMLHGIHGGDIETSLMLHLRPDLVRMDLARDFVSWGREMARDFAVLTPEGGVGFGWQMQDLHPAGVTGNAAAATAEKGRLVAARLAERFLAVAAEVSRYPLDRVVTRAPGGMTSGSD